MSSVLSCHITGYVPCSLQEREEAEAMWAADGQSVGKKDGEAEDATANARSQAPRRSSKERGRVTGGRDEL